MGRSCSATMLAAVVLACLGHGQDKPGAPPEKKGTQQQDSGQPVADAPAPATNTAEGQSGSEENPAPPEWESRAIVGYHQAGAASANFTQNFFFDFFIDRALSTKPSPQSPWTLWGDVRVASTPQQISAPVSTFITGFADQVSKVPVNQLAQSADFQSGLEFRPKRLQLLRSSASQIRDIGFVAFFGAMGQFSPPSSSVQIFTVPSPQSPQYGRFIQQYPSAANSQYIGFIPPDRDRFFRQYGAGIRITTFGTTKDSGPPGMYTFTLGQDEAITGGVMRSIVGRFDVFYPLPINAQNAKLKCIYLFGTAELRLARSQNLQAFALQNPNATSTVVNAYDPSVALVTVRSNRDTYRIGVGIDLVTLFTAPSNAGAPAVTKQ